MSLTKTVIPLAFASFGEEEMADVLSVMTIVDSLDLGATKIHTGQHPRHGTIAAIVTASGFGALLFMKDVLALPT